MFFFNFFLFLHVNVTNLITLNGIYLVFTSMVTDNQAAVYQPFKSFVSEGMSNIYCFQASQMSGVAAFLCFKLEDIWKVVISITSTIKQEKEEGVKDR